MADGTRSSPRVKICGLRRREDVVHADASGADYLGVILSAGFQRSVARNSARALVDGTAATPVAVLVDEGLDEAIRLGEALGAGVLQLHGTEPPAVVEALAARGSWQVWKSVRVRTPLDVAHAVAIYGAQIDALLIDAWAEGHMGGSGARIPLEVLSGVRTLVPEGLRLVVAGGLTPDTVGFVVRGFAPDVVDVSSGVERVRGEKDPDLVRHFIREAKRVHPESPPEQGVPT